jgi:hypothetical protein
VNLNSIKSDLAKNLEIQTEATKKQIALNNELEGRISEVSKKYDDIKKAYFKSKDERERLRQELEKFKGVKTQ